MNLRFLAPFCDTAHKIIFNSSVFNSGIIDPLDKNKTISITAEMLLKKTLPIARLDYTENVWKNRSSKSGMTSTYHGCIVKLHSLRMISTGRDTYPKGRNISVQIIHMNVLSLNIPPKAIVLTAWHVWLSSCRWSQSLKHCICSTFVCELMHTLFIL